MNGPLPLPNVAPSVLDQSTTVTLPAATTSAGIAEQPASGSNLHTWDVTSIVRQWVQDVHTNGGLALVGSGAPVTFASPLGSGSTSPTVDPVLDITYTPGGSVTPNFSDGDNITIYGLSGAFSACTTAVFVCGSPGGISTYGAEQLLGYGYTRIEAQLSCTLGAMPTAAPSNNSTNINTMLNSIYNNLDIPIVVLTPNSGCIPNETPSFWHQQAQTFVQGMSYPKGQLIYFEIGNEPNVSNYGAGGYSGYGGSRQGYADRFADAATGIETGMGSSPNYYILTGGMAQPTGSTSCADLLGDTNIYTAEAAIVEAEAYPNNVPASLLGVAVHPYGYRTNQTNFWKNYQYSWGSYWTLYSPYGPCTDISLMINLWTTMFSNFPVVITEDNWSDQPTTYPNTLCATQQQCEGTYLADLFTWIKDNGYGTPNASPLRVAWFTGLNIPVKLLGVLTASGTNKNVYLPTCPSTPALVGSTTEWTIFWYLDYSYTCY